jgi:hypothetical protein
MYTYVEMMCSEAGYTFASTWSNLEHVKKRLEGEGWIKGDENQTNYLRGL